MRLIQGLGLTFHEDDDYGDMRMGLGGIRWYGWMDGWVKALRKGWMEGWKEEKIDRSVKQPMNHGSERSSTNR